MIEDTLEQIPEPKQKSVRSLILKIFFSGLLAIVFISLTIGTYVANLNQPTSFTEPISVEIIEGDSVPMITEKLELAGVVQSGELLYFILVGFFDATKIKASLYVFDTPLTTYQVAERLIQGDFATDLKPITVFEGESREKVASRLSTGIAWFDKAQFLSLTADMEGELFPDTYFVPAVFSTEEFVELLSDTHQSVLTEYQLEIQGSDYTTEEILILASIIEREANTVESMRYVAGIFSNRLAIGMALQADASIEYVLEHELSELRPGELAASLREVDSPYNTYLYPGLPPTPIGNPGRDAIEAVLNPIPSDYFYYITGNDGNFYYAETYSEHLINIDRHLQ